MDQNNQTGEYKTPIFVANGKVAVEPFKEMAIEKEQRGGLVMAKQKGTLTKLRVVFNSGKEFVPESYYFPKGSSVWVRADGYALPWAKEILELDGEKFILIPVDQVLMFQY